MQALNELLSWGKPEKGGDPISTFSIYDELALCSCSCLGLL